MKLIEKNNFFFLEKHFKNNIPFVLLNNRKDFNILKYILTFYEKTQINGQPNPKN